MAVVAVLYAVLMTLYGAIWFLFPVAAFVFFILMTWAHWGQGEVHALGALLNVTHLKTPSSRGLVVLSRGAIPMLVPLVAFPEQYRFVAETLVGLFVDPALGGLSVVFTLRARATVALVLGVVLLTSLLLGYRRRADDREWLLDVGEVVLLVGFFATVPPILAVGLYFTVWHALRHIGRLLAIDPVARNALERGDRGDALVRFFADATPLTLAAVAIMVASYFLVPTTPVALADLIGLYLVVIAVLTLPHVIVVTWLDTVQGVWTNGNIRLT